MIDVRTGKQNNKTTDKPKKQKQNKDKTKTSLTNTRRQDERQERGGRQDTAEKD